MKLFIDVMGVLLKKVSWYLSLLKYVLNYDNILSFLWIKSTAKWVI